MDLPHCSLFIVQAGQLPAYLSSLNSKNKISKPDIKLPTLLPKPTQLITTNPKTLPLESLETALLTIPNVYLLPCGISTISDLKENLTQSKTYILFLIDLDENNTHCNFCLNSTHNKECLRGSALLSHLYNHIKSTELQNVVPLVMSAVWSPHKIKESLDLGAVDYFTKPISKKAAQSLWINVFRFHSLKYPTLIKRLPSFNLAPVGLFKKPALSLDSHLEGVIVDYYTPQSSILNRNPLDYSKFIRSSIRSQQLLRRIKRKKFNPYQLSESELITSCKIIFEDTFRQIGVPIIPGRLEKFILVTKSSYLENDYHNFCHAVDVLQATYLFLTSMGLKHISDPNVPCSIHLLSTKHITALLVAALGHDVGHPGVNNSFLIKTGIPLASMYSNVAVLEKFHALALVNLIHSQDCLFFPDLFSDLSEFYSLISDIIIATDMAAHFDHLKRIQDLGERRKFSDYKINEKDSLIILSALIKCSDLINVTRPFDIAKDWTRCLTEELHKQCCMELALGIDPQLPLDQLRGPQNASQVSFIQNMALPLFDCTADLLSELSLFPQQLQSNLSLWKHLDSSGLESPKSLENRPSSSLSPRQSRVTLVAGI